MGRKVNRLSDRKVKTITKPGRHADGNNLYLSISKPPAFGRRWVFLYRWKGKPTELGIGSARVVTLKDAREQALEWRRLLAKDINPKDARGKKDGATFEECSKELIEKLRPTWRSPKSGQAWDLTLGKYAVKIQRHPVADITTDDVLRVLSPIWKSNPETANRMRGRIEMVLEFSPENSGRTVVSFSEHEAD